MKNNSMIGQVMVSSNNDVIVYGPTRGLVSTHRTLGSAEKSLRRDQDGCCRQGGYSDALVYEWSDGRWSATFCGLAEIADTQRRLDRISGIDTEAL